VCRHLLRASQSDDLAVFSLALRVVFNLFVSIKDHMKVQLEVFLTSVHLRLLTP
jgi:golgi-specific brefeldin A-resistance guanine nucleotide exchange factor 1